MHNLKTIMALKSPLLQHKGWVQIVQNKKYNILFQWLHGVQEKGGDFKFEIS